VLGRARYERRRDEGVVSEESGLRNGFRPRRLQTAEGELSIEIPQVRQAAETFASKLFPRTPKLLRTEPLKALVIGAFVRGLSMRDVESLCEQAGLGSCRSRRPRGCARSSRSALSGFAGVISTRSASSRCSSTRLSSLSDLMAPRRGAGRLGVHRGRRARALGGEPGMLRGLAGPRSRSHRSRARRADADRC